MEWTFIHINWAFTCDVLVRNTDSKNKTDDAYDDGYDVAHGDGYDVAHDDGYDVAYDDVYGNKVRKPNSRRRCHLPWMYPVFCVLAKLYLGKQCFNLKYIEYVCGQYHYYNA